METNRNTKHLTENELVELKELAQTTVPLSSPLRGQEEVAQVLKKRGFGVREISRFLGDNGLPVSPATVSKYFAKTNGKATKNNNQPQPATA